MILRYGKFMEGYDREILKMIRDLADKTTSLKKSIIKSLTPKEIYEDYFLDFIENEGFTHYINNTYNILMTISLNKKIHRPKNIKSETEKYLRKSSMIIKRLESKFPDSRCHFEMKLNGKVQAIQRGHDRKDDILTFTGVGDPDPYEPKGTVSVKITFHIA